jgi:hypothetical protein
MTATVNFPITVNFESREQAVELYKFIANLNDGIFTGGPLSCAIEALDQALYERLPEYQAIYSAIRKSILSKGEGQGCDSF